MSTDMNMTTTKVIATTLLTFCALTFNACAPKYLKCEVVKPERTDLKQCSGEKTDFSFAQCVTSKYITLQGDYEALSVAFDGCK